MRRFHSSLIVSAMLLAGCSTSAPTALDPRAAGRIQTIAFSLPASPPLSHIVATRAELAQLGSSRTPSAVAENIRAEIRKRSAALDQAILTEGRPLSVELQGELRHAVEWAGYRTAAATRAPATGPGGPASFQAQALLQASVLAAGYTNDGDDGALVPFVTVRVRLVDVERGEPLFERTYAYNGFADSADNRRPASLRVLRLRAASQYRFASIAQLLADPPRASRGLFAVLPAVANDIAAALRNEGV